jgi:hypothetical protein
MMAESEMFGRVMQERTRKQHYASSNYTMESRSIEGKVRKRVTPSN